MAFKGNAGEVEVKKDLLLWTGIASAKVLLISPSIEELAKVGINFEREINYIDQTQNGEDRVRLDFWIRCKDVKVKMDIKTKLSFFITNRPRVDKDGVKTCYINNFGQTCWSADGVTFETWFRPQGMRPCLDGEDLLINFIRNWINAANDDEIFFDKLSNLFKGNFSELHGLLAMYHDTAYKQMLMVTKAKDQKFYQGTYNKFFARWNSTSTLPWQKYISGDKRNQPTTVPGGWSYQLKAFEPTGEEPTPDTDAPSAAVIEEADKW